jgi:hypothetical protein
VIEGREGGRDGGVRTFLPEDGGELELKGCLDGRRLWIVTCMKNE